MVRQDQKDADTPSAVELPNTTLCMNQVLPHGGAEHTLELGPERVTSRSMTPNSAGTTERLGFGLTLFHALHSGVISY
jgi:hypothetical protein